MGQRPEGDHFGRIQLTNPLALRRARISTARGRALGREVTPTRPDAQPPAVDFVLVRSLVRADALGTVVVVGTGRV